MQLNYHTMRRFMLKGFSPRVALYISSKHERMRDLDNESKNVATHEVK